MSSQRRKFLLELRNKAAYKDKNHGEYDTLNKGDEQSGGVGKTDTVFPLVSLSNTNYDIFIPVVPGCSKDKNFGNYENFSKGDEQSAAVGETATVSPLVSLSHTHYDMFNLDAPGCSKGTVSHFDENLLNSDDDELAIRDLSVLHGSPNNNGFKLTPEYSKDDAEVESNNYYLDNEIDDSDKDPDFTDSYYGSSSSSENENLATLKRKIVRKRLKLETNKKGQNISCRKRGRKVVKGDTREARKQRHILKNTGKGYITLKGRAIRRREFKQLESCRKGCRNKVSEETRKQIFDEYWKIDNYNKRVAYTASLILKEDKKTQNINSRKARTCNYKFHLKVNGLLVEICKGCFKKTFDLSNKYIENVTKKSLSISGVIHNDDRRGSHVPANKISEEKLDLVRKHILSIPSYESHYCREKTGDRRYLPSFYTLTRMYEEYKIAVAPEKPVSRKIYDTVFHKMNISIKRYSKDTCQQCDKLKMMMSNSKRDMEKEEHRIALQKHQEDAERAYSAKKEDKEEAVTNRSKAVYTFDMQQCLPTPNLNTSVAFYKRQLWTFNLTMHECTRNETTCYMWHEIISGTGANQVASCLYKELLSLPSHIKHVILYSDTCGGQNKNSHVAVMFMILMQRSSLSLIDHKFLIPGHTRMECDSDHSVIEKKKKKYEHPIEHPRDWYNLVRLCGKSKPFKVVEMKKDDFQDFCSLLKTTFQARKFNENGEKFVWKNVKWIRYDRTFGQIYYKESLDKNESFKTLSFLRRGQNSAPQNILKCKYPNVISEEKKANLIELLPYIDEVFHNFYQNLPTEKNVKDFLPDVDQDDLDEI